MVYGATMPLEARILSALLQRSRALLGASHERAREALAGPVASVPAGADVMRAALGHPLGPARGVQGTAWALALALEAGAEEVELLEGGFVGLTLGGRPIALAPVIMPHLDAGLGDPIGLARLVEGLDRAFGERSYVLHVKQPVPSSVEPNPVARAVQLWIDAVDRGEWPGRTAVFDDGALNVEFALGDLRGWEGPLAIVPPARVIDRVDRARIAMLDAMARYQASGCERPLVLSLWWEGEGATTRGYLQQLLYGLPESVETELGITGASSFRAFHRRSTEALLASDLAGEVAAVWWLEDAGEGIRALCHENPWTLRPERPLPPSVGGFRVDRVGDAAGSLACVRWRTASAEPWRIPP